MKQVNIGIGEYVISSNPDELLKSFALGSCVAVLVYDTDSKVAALAHIALPDSSVNTDKGNRKPGYFVDTCLPEMLGGLKRTGAIRKKVWIKLAGGANIMDENRTFDIGKRNVLAIKKYLWKMQLGIIAEDVGGSISRTVSLSVATGEVVISSAGKTWTIQMAGELVEYKKILIIDDSATSRMIIKRCFEIAGLRESEYIEVEDGLKAISFFEEDTADLIVTDLKMPKMDGGTLIQKLRSTKDVAAVPIVVISSMGSEIIDKELIGIGAQAVIRKPVSPEKIMSALESI